MDLELTAEQELLQKSVREFAEAEVRPHAKELDETGHFPREIFGKAAELGLTGIALPENEGGAGFDHVAYSIVIEEISRCCASTGVILSVQNSLYCDPLHRFGTAEQKEKFLLPFARGKDWLLRVDGTAGGFECGGVANQGGAQGRQLHRERDESVDHQRRRGGCGDCVCEYRSGQGRKGITALVIEQRDAGISRGQGRKETGDQRDGLQRAGFFGLRSAGGESHRE